MKYLLECSSLLHGYFALIGSTLHILLPQVLGSAVAQTINPLLQHLSLPTVFPVLFDFGMIFLSVYVCVCMCRACHRKHVMIKVQVGGASSLIPLLCQFQGLNSESQAFRTSTSICCTISSALLYILIFVPHLSQPCPHVLSSAK